MISMPAIAGVISIAFGIGGFFIGMDYKDKQHAETQLEKERELNRVVAQQAQRLHTLSEELEQAKADSRALFDDLEKQADKVVAAPLYGRDCIDDVGLRIINDALTRGNADTRKPDAAVPAAAAPNRKDR